MIGDPIETIDNAFGWRGFPFGLLYHAQFGLRFELGGDLEGPLRFVQALDRARAVASAVFSESQTLFVTFSIYGEEHATRRQSAAIQQLRQIGFRHPIGAPTKVAENDQGHFAEFGGDLYRYWYAAQFDRDEASVTALLWASIAREMDITPKARWVDTIHIADINKRLALTAYDDRGMDVIGPSQSALSLIYRKFDSWLLDYDRAEMDAKFSV